MYFRPYKSRSCVVRALSSCVLPTLVLAMSSTECFALDSSGDQQRRGLQAKSSTHDAAKRSSVSRFGITWTFDKKYPTGRFANGDWWVVGPVRIVRIDPPSKTAPRIINGSMINPGPIGGRQAYDSSTRGKNYVKDLNVALDVSAEKPLTVPPHSSLVSTISVVKPANRPQVQSAQILTVLPKPAKAGDFRPPYSGKNKSVRFNVKRLDYSLLKKLEPTRRVPKLAAVERMFERPWIDHYPGWLGTEIHPIDNMRHYGRDLCRDVSVGALVLHLDLPDKKKEKLLIGYVQLGIDLMGIVDAGGVRNWVAAGGHGSGRKWPILFAGMILNDPAMKGIGKRKDVSFGEDQQTFFVQKSDVGRPLNPNKKAAKVLYKESDVGRPEWGIEHAIRPQRDNANWAATYRRCCTANVWNGIALAARIMDAQKLWDHEPFFAYVDYYIPKSRAAKDKAWMTSWDPWTLEMWDRYRAKY